MDPIKELREISTPLPFEEQHMMQLIGSFNSEDTLTITRLLIATTPWHPISTYWKLHDGPTEHLYSAILQLPSITPHLATSERISNH